MSFLGLLDALNAQPITHKAIEKLRLRSVANLALGTVPLVRKLPSGVVYRCKYLDSLILASEIFGRGVYEAAVDPSVETFCDLGCNVGQFVAFVADRTGRRDLKGVAIDANRDMIRETAWVIAENKLDAVHPVLGLVGAGEAGSKGDFFVHPVGILSSRFAVGPPGEPKKGDFEKSLVGFLDLEAIWRGTVGDIPCDLLKVDIEGSESEVIVEENLFLRRVKRIVLECHTWVISLEELEARLTKLGFSRCAILEQHEATIVALYDRKGNP